MKIWKQNSLTYTVVFGFTLLEDGIACHIHSDLRKNDIQDFTLYPSMKINWNRSIFGGLSTVPINFGFSSTTVNGDRDFA